MSAAGGKERAGEGNPQMHAFQFKIKIEDQECENGCDPDRRSIA